MRSALLSSVMLGASSLTSFGGEILYQQAAIPPSHFQHNVVSQEFPDEPSFTTFAADDFTVTDALGWDIRGLQSVFTIGNGSGLPPNDVRWILWDDDGPGGVPGTELLNILGGSYDTFTGNALIDLQGVGANLVLTPGHYWVTTQVVGEINLFGQEFHRASLDGVGTSNFHWNNPGGGFGFPKSWFDANATINPGDGVPWSEVQNLAFRIDGVIAPEPGAAVLLAAGALFGARRRFRRRG